MTILLSDRDEDLVARLTQAAYDVALRRRAAGSFLDLQLELWDTLREVIEDEAAAVPEFATQVA